MKINGRTFAFFIAISSSPFLSSCASLKGELQGLSYPPSTAILIGDRPYQISTIKCATIKAVREDGALDCYDAEGRQSAPIRPISSWRRKTVEEQFGVKWGSPEHQAILFNFFYGGGKEQMAKALISATQQAATLRSMAASLDRSRDIQIETAQRRIEGASIYSEGGMSAWQAYQLNMSQWHLDNSRYFLDKIPPSSPGGLE